MGTGYLMTSETKYKPKMGLSIKSETKYRNTPAGAGAQKKEALDSFIKTKKKKKPIVVKRYRAGSEKEDGINKNLQSMGYNNIQDFYSKHPESNFDVTPLSTKMIRGAGRTVMKTGRAVKKLYKRYVKKD